MKDVELTKYKGALAKIFTPKQTNILLTGKKHAKWTDGEIGKFITMRYKANTYEYMRTLGFPFASTRTLQRFTQKIDFSPGILKPILSLLKNEFQDASEISRQCSLVFDEMALEGSFAYDSVEDKIYPPSVNINAYVLRGLFSPWKQVIAYEFNDDFNPEKMKDIITAVENIGLHVRTLVCDLGGKNRGMLNKLGVKVRKIPSTTGNKYAVVSSFKNPIRTEDEVWVFPDAPHMIKLIRDNMFKNGLQLEPGIWLRKEDFEQLLKVDSDEMQSNYKLQRKHLDVNGLQKCTVSLAVQLFSNTTAALWEKVYPNRVVQQKSIKLVNDWFDLMNSRTTKEHCINKQPFGCNLASQMELLDEMETWIMKIRVGNAKHLLPFQRGILTSINSTRGLFNEMSGSSMRFSYILTNKVNQDVVENLFSMIRKVGALHQKPSAVDAKRRLKLICLSWGGSNLKTSAVQKEDDEPFLSSRMMHSLTTPTTNALTTLTSVELHEDVPVVNTMTEENVEEEEERALGGLSWVQSLKKERLTIPSFKWRNWAEILDAEFESFHLCGGKYYLETSCGVVKGFTAALVTKYTEIPKEPLALFIKTKMFIRIKNANIKLKEERREAAKKRMERWGRVR
ncbi:Transposable element P transposase, partial [Folsomia candida]